MRNMLRILNDARDIAEVELHIPFHVFTVQYLVFLRVKNS